MNPIDILGGMLGRKSGGSGRSGGSLGGSILESILKGRARSSPSSSSSSGSTSHLQRPAGSPTIRPRSDSEQFDSLEDLLRHAHQSNRQRGGSTQRGSSTQQPSFPEPTNERIQQRQTDFNDRFTREPAPFNDAAKILVIAMINAAKSDGQIDQKEQDAIVKELGDLSQQEIQFLRSEFAKPLDVKEFVWSVPLGMEQQVYAVSLIAIDLDRQAEANYLKQLGHGLRMTQESCNRIHKEFNAPAL
ncbi:MAG: DUF533 domain-containing protein [Fuerstiella sp.]